MAKHNLPKIRFHTCHAIKFPHANLCSQASFGYTKRINSKYPQGGASKDKRRYR